METEKTLEILKNIPEKHNLTPKEKEAVAAAVGLLSLIIQSKNKAKAQKAKRDKSIEW
jgi:hypothetical protein